MALALPLTLATLPPPPLPALPTPLQAEADSSRATEAPPTPFVSICCCCCGCCCSCCWFCCQYSAMAGGFAPGVDPSFFCTQRRCCPRWRNVDPNCCVQFECFLFSCLQVNIYNLLSCEICNLVASLKLSISQQIVTFTRILLVIFARKKQMKTHCVRVCKCDSYMACECC